MTRLCLEIICCSAIYGFSIGAVHSLRVACWNLLKFPTLIFSTGLLCGMAYHAFSLLFTRELSVREVAGLSLRIYRDISLLLAALSPVALFLALTLKQPAGRRLNEYPLFLGLNVLAIASCGTLALTTRTLWLIRERRLPNARSIGMLLVWLLVSVGVGGQCAWFLRPFFGISTIRNIPFIEGRNPDFRGATSFYEAVWHIVDPPPLPEDFREYRKRHRLPY